MEDGKFCLDDLIGCEVVDENQTSLGKVVEVLTPAAHEVLVIKQGETELLVPLVDEWVVAVDITAGRIQINTAEEI